MIVIHGLRQIEIKYCSLRGEEPLKI